jgi:uncharacterized protein with ParB-like and HNH nuclease domain
MKAYKENFREFITAGRRTFSIPVYQRNYEWGESECRKLFSDIEFIAESGQTHFVGTIVYVTSENSTGTWNEFTVIDGQQRITTVMLLLKAIHSLTDDEDVKDEIWSDYLTNKRAKEEKYRLKLKPIESDALVWANLIDDGTSTNKASNLWRNYDLFKSWVDASRFTPNELFEAIGKLEIVYIQLETGKENPQLIFESINSTGLNLTTGDLIRNFLLMNCDAPEKQTLLYKNYWIKIEKMLTPKVIPDFVRDYLTMKMGSLVKIGNVYDTFKQYAREHFLGSEESLLAELRRYAEYYSWCMFYQSENKELNSLLYQFHEIKSLIAFEVLLWFFDKCYEKRELSEDGLISVIKILLSYQYRRLVCKAQYNFSLSTNALNSTYAAIPREIGDADDIPAKLLDILASKTRSQTFPRNDVFRTAFLTFDLYSAKLAKYTLAMLENSLNPIEKVALTEEITIEHIMPQTLTPVWKVELGKDFEQIHSQLQHTIGNLTLSGNNSKLNNESFSKKKVVYTESNIALSRDAAKADSWTAKEIQERASRLFEKALTIWELPEKYNKTSESSQLDYSVNYNIMDDVIITGESPKSYIFGGKEVAVDSWKTLFIGVLRELYEFDASTFEKFRKHETVVRKHLAEPDDTDYQFITSSSGRKVVEGYTAETNYPAQDLLSFTQIAVEIYGLEDDVEFKIKRKSAPSAAVVVQREDDGIETAFKHWMVATGKAENTANQYASILRGALVRAFEMPDGVSKNLFEYEDAETFAETYATIRALPNWEQINALKHNSFSAAAKAYSEFLSGRE